jgi:hypothetical protein
VQPDLCWFTSSRKALVGNHIRTVCTNVQGCGLNFQLQGTSIIDTNGSVSFYINE